MQGGGRRAPRKWRRGASPEHDTPQAKTPRVESKNVCVWRALGAGAQGANLGGLPTRGNHCDPDPLHTALAERNPRSDTAVPTKGRAPTRGVPPGAPDAPGAGGRQGQRGMPAKSTKRPYGRCECAKWAMVAKDNPQQRYKKESLTTMKRAPLNGHRDSPTRRVRGSSKPPREKGRKGLMMQGRPYSRAGRGATAA